MNFSQKEYSVFLLYCVSNVIIGSLFAQTRINVSGLVKDIWSDTPISNVTVACADKTTTTDALGTFNLSVSRSQSEVIIEYRHPEFHTVRVPLRVSNQEYIQLGTVFMKPDQSNVDLDLILLAPEDLETADQHLESSAILQSQRSVFSNTAAFQWSSSFFRPRGYDSEHQTILINGIPMNATVTGRPDWSIWGGLNPMFKYPETSEYTAPSEATVGSLSGVSHFRVEPLQQRRRSSLAIAGANRSYQTRVIASHHTGKLKDNWALSVALSGRYGQQGFFEGTTYQGYSGLLALDKKFGSRHTVSFLGFYAPTERGRTAPVTDEVFELKGRRYNPYWGWDQGNIRNSRITTTKMPVGMFSHQWQMGSKWFWKTTAAIQSGYRGSSRISYTGSQINSGNDGQTYFASSGVNPDPVYYQNVPSYFLRNSNSPDYASAYLAQSAFLEGGQLSWHQLREFNRTAKVNQQNAVYVVYEDRTQTNQLDFTTHVSGTSSTNALWDFTFSARKQIDRNHAVLADLLEGSSYLDINAFETGQRAQNNLKQPNRTVYEGDTFLYDYKIHSQSTSAFAQIQIPWRKWNVYLGVQANLSAYYRDGQLENGIYPGKKSLGESKKLNFLGYTSKFGFQYRLNGHHSISTNAMYQIKPPGSRMVFVNPRQRNTVNSNVHSRKIFHYDVGYQIRYSKWLAKIQGYATQIQNESRTSFYFTNELPVVQTDIEASFVQESLTGINQQHLGLEFETRYEMSSGLYLKSAIAYGEHKYINDPQLFLYGDDIQTSLDLGKSDLTKYRLANGPQKVYHLGMEYKDPGYWWCSLGANYFSEAFVQVSPITRTTSFIQDSDGMIFSNYSKETADKILTQEEFKPYITLNAIGGKSWKIKKVYTGFTLGINNILNTLYKTGGFEQSRLANYPALVEDKERNKPIFGSKYWFGAGTTYYLNYYIHF